MLSSSQNYNSYQPSAIHMCEYRAVDLMEGDS